MLKQPQSVHEVEKPERGIDDEGWFRRLCAAREISRPSGQGETENIC
jgi:hypothetical protein